MDGEDESPSVSIVVLNWNGAADTCRCLDSLREITYGNFRTIVVDNGSDGDDVARIREEHDDLIDIVIENDVNLGYAAGNNIGIRHAISEFESSFVLLLNNDAVLESDAVSGLLRGAEEEDAGIVGPKICSLENKSELSSAGGRIYQWFGQHKMRGKGERDTGQYNTPQTVDFVSGACMLVRREVFEEVGLIPTEYFLQWEDIDFCTQAKEADFKVLYWPDSTVYHEVNASFEREEIVYPMVARGFRNRIWYFRRHSTPLQKVLLGVLFPLLTAPVHILYYTLLRRDFQYLRRFCEGLFKGVRYNIGEGPDPDRNSGRSSDG